MSQPAAGTLENHERETKEQAGAPAGKRGRMVAGVDAGELFWETIGLAAFALAPGAGGQAIQHVNTSGAAAMLVAAVGSLVLTVIAFWSETREVWSVAYH